jgi:hypothetical protein
MPGAAALNAATSITAFVNEEKFITALYVPTEVVTRYSLAEASPATRSIAV